MAIGTSPEFRSHTSFPQALLQHVAVHIFVCPLLSALAREAKYAFQSDIDAQKDMVSMSYRFDDLLLFRNL
eukprot:2312143-Pyramimonas_sp.AAC.1